MCCIASSIYAGTFQGKLLPQSHAARDFGFDIMETFDDIQDWPKSIPTSDLPKRDDGSSTPFNVYEYTVKAEPADSWIKDHRINGGYIWDPLCTGSGKSLCMDLSKRTENGLGDGKRWGPDRFGMYFGDGNRTSGYADEMYVFFMVRMPSAYFPTRMGNIYPVWLNNKIYSPGDRVVPTDGEPNRWYECILGGKSGSSEPIWLTTTASTIIDGELTWQTKYYPSLIGTYVKGENYTTTNLWIKFITMGHGFVAPWEHGDNQYYECAHGTYGWHSDIIHFAPHNQQPEVGTHIKDLHNCEGSYQDIKEVWQPGYLYNNGDKVISLSFPSNPYFYQVKDDGGTSSQVGNEPTWPMNYGAQVIDNNITWECKGKSWEGADEHRINCIDAFTNVRIPMDQWIGIEVHYKLNEPGKDNGIEEIWYYDANGKEHHLIALTNVFNRAIALQGDAMNWFFIGGNNSNTFYWGPGMEPRFFVDDLIIDGNRIGPKYFAKKLQGDITGDVNGDRIINVLDVQACVNHILDLQDWAEAADVNGDGNVDVLDVQMVVNKVLGE